MHASMLSPRCETCDIGEISAKELNVLIDEFLRNLKKKPDVSEYEPDCLPCLFSPWQCVLFINHCLWIWYIQDFHSSQQESALNETARVETGWEM